MSGGSLLGRPEEVAGLPLTLWSRTFSAPQPGAPEEAARLKGSISGAVSLRSASAAVDRGLMLTDAASGVTVGINGPGRSCITARGQWELERQALSPQRGRQPPWQQSRAAGAAGLGREVLLWEGGQGRPSC